MKSQFSGHCQIEWSIWFNEYVEDPSFGVRRSTSLLSSLFHGNYGQVFESNRFCTSTFSHSNTEIVESVSLLFCPLNHV